MNSISLVELGGVTSDRVVVWENTRDVHATMSNSQPTTRSTRFDQLFALFEGIPGELRNNRVLGDVKLSAIFIRVL